MGEYRTSGHAIWDIKYHLIWITKYRYLILRGEVAERARDVIRSGICQARGYFCATVGVMDEKTMMEYIENQKWDDDAESFKITEPTKP